MTVPFNTVFISQWSSFLIWVGFVFAILILFRKVRLLQKPFLFLGLGTGHLIPLVDIAGFLFLLTILIDTFYFEESTARFVYTLLIAAAVLWTLRSVLMDCVTGVFLRLENGFQVGNRIEIEEGAGLISKVGFRSLTISLDGGKSISLPYSRLSSTTFQKPPADRALKTGVIELTVKKDSSVAEMQKHLRQCILMSPWPIMTESPVVQPFEESGDRIRFRITVSFLDQTHMTELEYALRQQFQSF